MLALFKNAKVRLLGRAVVAALLVVLTQIHNSNGTQIAWQSIAVAAGLAFIEVVTPLNRTVGIGKS
jgi:hypothetical protein